MLPVLGPVRLMGLFLKRGWQRLTTIVTGNKRQKVLLESPRPTQYVVLLTPYGLYITEADELGSHF